MVPGGSTPQPRGQGGRLSARGGTRTHTPVRAADFKSATSTDSVTRAWSYCRTIGPAGPLTSGVTAQRGSTQRGFLVARPSVSVTQGTGQSSGSTQGDTSSPTGLALPALVSA